MNKKIKKPGKNGGNIFADNSANLTSKKVENNRIADAVKFIARCRF